jgi:hypothetical protein
MPQRGAEPGLVFADEGPVGFGIALLRGGDKLGFVGIHQVVIERDVGQTAHEPSGKRGVLRDHFNLQFLFDLRLDSPASNMKA